MPLVQLLTTNLMESPAHHTTSIFLLLLVTRYPDDGKWQNVSCWCWPWQQKPLWLISFVHSSSNRIDLWNKRTNHWSDDQQVGRRVKFCWNALKKRTSTMTVLQTVHTYNSKCSICSTIQRWVVEDNAAPCKDTNNECIRGILTCRKQWTPCLSNGIKDRVETSSVSFRFDQVQIYWARTTTQTKTNPIMVHTRCRQVPSQMVACPVQWIYFVTVVVFAGMCAGSTTNLYSQPHWEFRGCANNQHGQHQQNWLHHITHFICRYTKDCLLEHNVTYCNQPEEEDKTHQK